MMVLELFNKKYSYYNTWIITAFFILFAGIRYGVGNDYFSYYDNYLGINHGTGTDSTEIIYVLLNKVLSFELIIFFFSFFSFLFLKKAIDYFCPRYGVTAYLIFYTFFLITYELHIIRQGLAISMILYGYKFLFEKKYVNYILIVILASMFHVSSIILLPFIFLVRINITVKIQIIFFVFSLIMLIFQDSIITIYYFLATNTPILNKYLLVYRQAERSSYGVSSGMILDLLVLLFFMIKQKTLNDKENFLFRIFFISVVLTFVLSLDPAALRLTYYFRTVNIFLIPLLFEYFKYKIIPFTFILAISGMYLYITFTAISEYGRGDRNLHYYTIFNKYDYHQL